METQDTKFERFRSLHFQETAFVIPNPWDAGSARILAALGFDALATSSAGYAFSVASLRQSKILTNAKTIVAATNLPVSADLEDGFGASPDACSDTVTKACDIGLVGGSTEDASGDPDQPILDFRQSVERIEAAAAAANDRPLFLTARAENFLWGRPNLADTIQRLKAFSAAGANVLYAPSLPDINAIKTVCAEVDKPVNVVMGLGVPTYSVQELTAPGVRRVYRRRLLRPCRLWCP